MAGLQAIHRIQLTKEYKNTDENKAIGYLRSRDNNVGGCRSMFTHQKGEYAKGSATVYCDEGFKTILDEEIQVFEFSYPEASIIPFYVSEQEAIDKFLADKTQAIIVTRELTKDQIKYMKSKFKRVVRTNCIAVDAVALITNKENPVDQLSLQEIGDILSGKISRWSQLAGSDTTAIKIVFDNPGSSTVSYMRHQFLPAGTQVSDNPNAFGQKNNAQVLDLVKKRPKRTRNNQRQLAWRRPFRCKKHTA